MPNEDESEIRLKISLLFRILDDALSYSVAEIASLIGLPHGETTDLLKFLSKYHIVTYDEERNTAVICDDVLELI